MKVVEFAHSRFKEIADLGVCLSGLHFHCGSSHSGSKNFDNAVYMARELIKIGRMYGHSMEILDVGGGFGAQDIGDDI